MLLTDLLQKNTASNVPNAKSRLGFVMATRSTP
jgi:hypothetical protein